MQENLCDPIAQETTCDHIGRVVEIEVDPCPPDEHSKNEKEKPVSWKPIGENGCHHKGKCCVGAGEAGVDHFPRTLGELGSYLEKVKRSHPLDEEF